MNPETQLLISASSVLMLFLGSAIFYLSWRKLGKADSAIQEIRKDVGEQEEIATVTFGKEVEDFETKISNISEKLQIIAEERYSLEEINSYNSLLEELDEFSKEDELAEDLLNSFLYLEERNLEDELTEDEKALIRKASYGILRFPSDAKSI